MTEAATIPGDVAHAAATSILGQLITVFPQPIAPTGSGIVAVAIRAEHKVSNTDDMRVFVFEQGLVWESRRKSKQSADGWETERLDPFRWAEVTDFTQSTVRTATTNGITRTRHAFKFALNDGRTFRISREAHHGSKASCFNGLERFAATVDPLVTAAQVPLAEVSLRRGEKVRCGVLAVDFNGLHYKDRFLAWPEFEETTFANGSLEIRQRGQKKSWASVGVPGIANLNLLLAIIRSTGTGQAHSAAGRPAPAMAPPVQGEPQRTPVAQQPVPPPVVPQPVPLPVAQQPPVGYVAAPPNPSAWQPQPQQSAILQPVPPSPPLYGQQYPMAMPQANPSFAPQYPLRTGSSKSRRWVLIAVPVTVVVLAVAGFLVYRTMQPTYPTVSKTVADVTSAFPPELLASSSQCVPEDVDVDNGHDGRMKAVDVTCRIGQPAGLGSAAADLYSGVFDGYINSKESSLTDSDKALPTTEHRIWNSDKSAYLFVNNGTQASYTNSRRMLRMHFGFEKSLSSAQIVAYAKATGLL